MHRHPLDPRSKLTLVFSAAVVVGTLGRWPFLLASAGFFVGLIGWLGRLKSGWKFFQGLGPAVLGFFAVAWLAFDLSLALAAAARLLALGLLFSFSFRPPPPRTSPRPWSGWACPTPSALY